jgi:hypothetical protein
MTGLLVFMGVNLALFNTITPIYDFVCFLPYWERRVPDKAHPFSSFLTLLIAELSDLGFSLLILLYFTSRNTDTLAAEQCLLPRL